MQQSNTIISRHRNSEPTLINKAWRKKQNDDDDSEGDGEDDDDDDDGDQ